MRYLCGESEWVFAIRLMLKHRSPKDVQDTHSLVMHTYCSDDASSRVHHLGLHKALCVLMGWNFSKAPDNSKAYQNLPAEEAAINQAQLIIWPPHVIVHNTSTGKGKEGRMEGYGNKTMDNRIRGTKSGLSFFILAFTYPRITIEHNWWILHWLICTLGISSLFSLLSHSILEMCL